MKTFGSYAPELHIVWIVTSEHVFRNRQKVFAGWRADWIARGVGGLAGVMVDNHVIPTFPILDVENVRVDLFHLPKVSVPNEFFSAIRRIVNEGDGFGCCIDNQFPIASMNGVWLFG